MYSLPQGTGGVNIFSQFNNTQQVPGTSSFKLPPAFFDGFSCIAVVGLSPKSNRPSHQVARYLLAVGYTVVPVNPGHNEVMGLPCYPDLLSIERPVDLINIFRRSECVPPIVRDAVTIGAGVIWMQQGVINQRATHAAEQAGLQVIMDCCLKIEHMRSVADR